jgi:hypothetical protein
MCCENNVSSSAGFAMGIVQGFLYLSATSMEIGMDGVRKLSTLCPSLELTKIAFPTIHLLDVIH